MQYYIKVGLQHVAMGLIIPISVVWKLQNGLSLTEALLTESIVLLTTAICDLPAGLIANRLTNKASLIIGGVLHVVAVGLLASGNSFWVFAVAAIAMGAAWAFVSGADEAYIHDDYLEDKSDYQKVFATASIVDEASTVVGMVAASVLIYLHTSLRTLFILAAVILVVHVVYALISLPPSQKLVPTHPKAAAMFMVSVKLHLKQYKAIVMLFIAFAVVYEAGRPLWQPQLERLGFDIASFGIIFAVLKLASLAGSVIPRYRPFHDSDIGIVFFMMLTSLLVFSTQNKLLSLIALGLFLMTENYFRIYMSTTLNRLITSRRAAMLSFGSVIRNGTGALLIAGAGVFSKISIFYALLALVLAKLPAVIYLLRFNKATHKVY